MGRPLFTGFFEYAEQGGVIAAEWSENIENALPAGTVTVSFEQRAKRTRDNLTARAI
ncbi:MAG: hypothetical protein ACLR56_07515 [Oscillospiraceae bacterium]